MRRLIILVVDAVLWLSGKVAYLIFFLCGWRFISIAGKLTGVIIYHLNKKRRKRTEKELKLLFGKRLDGKEIKDITKRSFKNYYQRQIETVFFGALNKNRIERIIDVEGTENLDTALSKGKGVILLLSHFGFFLLPLPFLGFRGYRINQVTGKQIHRSLIAERMWLWRKREAERLPVNFIQVDKFLRPVYAALRNNEIIAIAFDGRDGSKWVVTDFFERTARFSTGPFELARRTGATIIPTFVIRENDGRHKLIFEPPFKLAQAKACDYQVAATFSKQVAATFRLRRINCTQAKDLRPPEIPYNKLIEENDMAQALSTDVRNFAELFANYIARYPCHFGMVLSKGLLNN